MAEDDSGDQSCTTVKVTEPSGIWYVSPDPTAHDKRRFHRRWEIIPGWRLARRLSPRRRAERDTWHTIQRPEIKEKPDLRSWMKPENRSARQLEISGGCKNKCCPRGKLGGPIKAGLTSPMIILFARDPAKRTWRFGSFHLSVPGTFRTHASTVRQVGL